MMKYKLHRLVTAIMFFLLSAENLSASENKEPLHVQWQHVELTIQNRQTFTNELKLVNLSPKMMEIRITMDLDNSVFLSKKLPEMLVLQPGQKTIIKIAGTRLRENNTPCVITTTIASNNINEIRTGFVLIAEKLKNPVKAVFDNQSRYFTATTDTIIVPLKMQNYSSEKQVFSYSIKDEANGLEYILESENPWLEAYESKMFLLKIFRNERFKDFLNYKLNVDVYDQNKKPVLQSFIPVHSISSFYRMSNPTGINKGELSVEYRTLKDNYQISDIRYADKVKLGDGNLSFQLHHQYYLKQRFSQIFNSYLQWNNTNSFIKLGEIYTAGELTNFGNGFYLKHTSKNEEHELSGIFNSRFIYSSVPVFIRNRKTFAYSFTKAGKKSTHKYQLGYTDDINTGGSGLLAHVRQYHNLPNGRIEAGFGISNEVAKFRSQSTLSLATELVYRQRFDKWLIESNASFAGRHYLGQNRGQQTISARFRYDLSDRKQFSFGQYWQKNSPEYYNNFLPREYEYFRLFSEYSFRKTNSLHTVKVKYQNESLGDFYFTPASDLTSAILGYETNFSIRNKHIINISGDIAFQKLGIGVVTKSFTAFRMKAAWRYQNIASRITWQNGVFNLNHYSFFRPEGYGQTEWLTQYRIKLPYPKLEASMQFGLYKEDFYENIRSRVIIDMSYHPSAHMTLNIGITKLSNFLWQQPEFKIGFTYKPGLLRHDNNKNIRIRAFHDKNGNSKKDESEQWAPSIHMMAGGRAMMTDQDGMIRVQNVPRGDLTLNMPGSGQTRKISVNKSTEIIIPVETMFTVQGKLIFTGKFADTTVQLADRIISFKPIEGREYLTAISANGTFDLQLSPGKYYISIHGLGDVRLHNKNEQYLDVEKDILDAKLKVEVRGRKINHHVLALAMQ